MRSVKPIARVLENKAAKVLAERRQNALKHLLNKQDFRNEFNYCRFLYQIIQNEWRVADQYGIEQIFSNIYAFTRTVIGFIRELHIPFKYYQSLRCY